MCVFYANFFLGGGKLVSVWLVGGLLSNVTLRSGGIFEKHVEEAIFHQITSAALLKFFRAACCCNFVQSSLQKFKKKKKFKLIQTGAKI